MIYICVCMHCAMLPICYISVAYEQLFCDYYKSIYICTGYAQTQKVTKVFRSQYTYIPGSIPNNCSVVLFRSN